MEVVRRSAHVVSCHNPPLLRAAGSPPPVDHPTLVPDNYDHVADCLRDAKVPAIQSLTLREQYRRRPPTVADLPLSTAPGSYWFDRIREMTCLPRTLQSVNAAQLRSRRQTTVQNSTVEADNSTRSLSSLPQFALFFEGHALLATDPVTED